MSPYNFLFGQQLTSKKIVDKLKLSNISHIDTIILAKIDNSDSISFTLFYEANRIRAKIDGYTINNEILVDRLDYILLKKLNTEFSLDQTLNLINKECLGISKIVSYQSNKSRFYSGHYKDKILKLKLIEFRLYYKIENYSDTIPSEKRFYELSLLDETLNLNDYRTNVTFYSQYLAPPGETTKKREITIDPITMNIINDKIFFEFYSKKVNSW